jgi:tRNA (adenine37-N6)-methyltransferase
MGSGLELAEGHAAAQYDMSMPQQIEFNPIGVVHSSALEPVDDVWGGVKCRIDLDPSRFSPECLRGLDDFSHVEVVFFFHRVSESEIATGSRHPRNRPDYPRVGIFAQRGKTRPNRIGVTICRLLSVKDLSLEVVGLDAIDGTPVLDVKPYMREFAARGEIRQPGWVDQLMRGYWENTYFG